MNYPKEIKRYCPKCKKHTTKNTPVKEDYVIFDEIKLGTNINTREDYERLVNFA